MTFIKKLTIKQLLAKHPEDAEGVFIPYPAESVETDLSEMQPNYAAFVIVQEPEQQEDPNGRVSC